MATVPKTAQNLLTSATTLASQVGAFTPLAQISSVVQSLQNLQGFNPGQFTQIAGSIKSALQGFDQASSIISNFAGNSPVGAFTNSLASTGLAGSSIAAVASAGATAYKQADTFLSTIQQADSFSRLSSERVSVEKARAANPVGKYLQFPEDIGKYWISLEFVESKIQTNWNANPIRETSKGGVIFPVPTNLQDNDSLEYSSISLTKSAADLATGAATLAATALGSSKFKLSNRITDSLSSAASALSSGAEAAGSLMGIAVNTNQILKFNQPTLKSHTFSWRLVPSSKKEALMIHSIVMYIKSCIYPGKGLGFFKYPNLVKVVLSNKDQMYLFRPAYVKSFSVTYNPDGQAFHRDQYPVAVQIDMTIQENSVWSSGDFSGAVNGYDYTIEEMGRDIGNQLGITAQGPNRPQ